MTVVGDVEVDVMFLTAKGEAQLAAKLKTLGAGSAAAPKIPTPDTKEAEAGIDRFAKLAASKFQGVAGSANSIIKNFRDVESAGFDLGGLAGPLGLLLGGVTALAVGVVASAKGFTSYGEEVRRFSVSSGLGAEQSSRFVSAIDRLGGSAEKVRTGFFFLSRNIEANTKLLQEHSDLIVRDAKGNADLTATFLKAADAIHNTADAQQRNAIAAALFGRQARDLVPILALGSDAIERQLALTDKLGLTLDASGIEKAREFTVASRTMGQALKGLEVEIGSEVLPALTKLEGAATRTIEAFHSPKDLGGIFKDFVSALSKGNILQALEAIGKKQYDAAAAAAADAQDENDSADAKLRVADALLQQLDAEDAVAASSTRLYQAQLKVNDIQAQIAELQKGGGDAAKKLAAAQDELRSAYERLEDVQHKVDDSTVSITQKQSDLADAILRFGPASHQALDAQKALNDAIFEQKRNSEDLADAKKKVGDADANEKDIRQNEKTRELADLNSQLATAQGEVETSTKTLAKANSDLRVAQDGVNDKTDTATDKVRIYKEELEKVRDTLAPGSPLRKNIEDTIAELNTLDPTGAATPGQAFGATAPRPPGVAGPTLADGGTPFGATAPRPPGTSGPTLAGVGTPPPIVVNAAPQQSPQQIAAAIGFDLARRATSTAAPR